jgi:hypothetical protein
MIIVRFPGRFVQTKKRFRIRCQERHIPAMIVTINHSKGLPSVDYNYRFVAKNFASTLLNILILLILSTSAFQSVNCFTISSIPFKSTTTMQDQQSSLSFDQLGSLNAVSTSSSTNGSVCDLPGDPSLILTTNVDLGTNKLDIMKGTSFRL